MATKKKAEEQQVQTVSSLDRLKSKYGVTGVQSGVSGSASGSASAGSRGEAGSAIEQLRQRYGVASRQAQPQVTDPALRYLQDAEGSRRGLVSGYNAGMAADQWLPGSRSEDLLAQIQAERQRAKEANSYLSSHWQEYDSRTLREATMRFRDLDKLLEQMASGVSEAAETQSLQYGSQEAFDSARRRAGYYGQSVEELEAAWRKLGGERAWALTDEDVGRREAELSRALRDTEATYQGYIQGGTQDPKTRAELRKAWWDAQTAYRQFTEDVALRGTEAAANAPDAQWLRQYIDSGAADYDAGVRQYGVELDRLRPYEVLQWAEDPARDQEQRDWAERYMQREATAAGQFGVGEYRRLAEEEREYNRLQEGMTQEQRGRFDALLEAHTARKASPNRDPREDKAYKQALLEYAKAAGISREEAFSQLQSVVGYTDYASAQEQRQRNREYATAHPLSATAQSYATNLVGNPIAAAYLYTSKLFGLEPRSSSDWLALYNATTDVRQQVARDIETGETTMTLGLAPNARNDATLLSWNMSGVNTAGGQNVGSWLYNAVNSTIDSAITMTLTQGLIGGAANLSPLTKKIAGNVLTNAILGSGAAMQEYAEAVQSGADSDQAALRALLAGGIEGMTEYVGGETVWKNILSDKTALKAVLSSMLSEGTEEVASNQLTRMMRNAFRAYNKAHGGGSEAYELDAISALVGLIGSYEALGYDGEKAFQEAVRAALGDDLSSFLAGAFSGGLSTAGGRAIQSAATAAGDLSAGRRMIREGYRSGENLAALNSEIGDLGLQLREVGQGTRAYGLGRTLRLVTEARTAANVGQAVQDLEPAVREALRGQGIREEIAGRMAGPMSRELVATALTRSDTRITPAMAERLEIEDGDRRILEAAPMRAAYESILRDNGLAVFLNVGEAVENQPALAGWKQQREQRENGTQAGPAEAVGYRSSALELAAAELRQDGRLSHELADRIREDPEALAELRERSGEEIPDGGRGIEQRAAVKRAVARLLDVEAASAAQERTEDAGNIPARAAAENAAEAVATQTRSPGWRTVDSFINRQSTGPELAAALRQHYDGAAPAADYLRDMNVIYQAARGGTVNTDPEGFSRMLAQVQERGLLTEAAIDAAYEAGELAAQAAQAGKEGTDNGERTENRGVRQGGAGTVSQRAAEQAEGVRQGAEATGEQRDAGQGAAAAERQSGGAYEEVSARRILPEAAADSRVRLRNQTETESDREAESLAKKHGLSLRVWEGGGIRLAAGGEIRGYARMGTGEIGVQGDNAAVRSADLARHEIMEQLIGAGKVDVDAVLARATAEGLDSAMLETAVELYRRSNPLEGIEGARKELVCDSADHINQLRYAVEQGATAYADLAALLDRVVGAVHEAAAAITGNAFDLEGAAYELGAKENAASDGGAVAYSREIVNSDREYDFSVTQQDINSYVDAAYESANTSDYRKYLKVNDRLAEDVSESIPDIREYAHALRDNDIRHIRNSHGEQTNEKYPVTADDQKAIPDIVQNYDRVIVKYRKGVPGLVYVKVVGENLVYYLESVTDQYHNEKLLVNKQMIKTGMGDVPNLSGLMAAIEKKQPLADFLADLRKIRKAYVQDASQTGTASTDSVAEDAAAVKTEYSRSLAALEELREQNAALRKDLTELRQKLAAKTEQAARWKGETRRTAAPTLRQQDVERVTRELLRSYDSKADRTEIAGQVKALGEFILRGGEAGGDELSWSAVKERAVSIAREIVENAEALAETGGDGFHYDAFRAYLKSQRIYFPAQYRQDVTPESWAAFRRSLFGRVNLVSSSSAAGVIGMDTAYQELQETYGEILFPADIVNPADQLDRVLEVLQSFQPVYENPYSYDMAAAIEYASNELLDTLLSDQVRQTVPTYADRAEARLQEAKAKGRQAVERVRQQRDARVAALREQYRESAQRRRERKADSDARTRLLKIARRLERMKTTDDNRRTIRELIGDLDLVSKGITGRTLESLEALEDWYKDRLENDKDFIPDERTEKTLERLRKRRIAELGLEEVQDLTDALLNIEHEIRTEKKLIDTQDRRTTYEMGVEIIRDVENAWGAAPTGLDAAVDKLVLSDVLSPERQIRRLTGYADGDPLYQAAKDLSRGQREMFDYQRRANALFQEWVGDRAFIDGITGKKAGAVEITGQTAQGPVTVKITPAMRMSLYLHGLNGQNMRHIDGGGVTVPDFDLYTEGKIQEAFDRGVTLRLTRSQVAGIAAGMTEKERAFARAASAYFNGMSRDSINAVSEKLKGYSLAGVENYFPINTDKSFTKTDFESVKFDGTIEGMGMLKERVNASNPIMLEDMTAVLNRSIGQHAKYVGLAVPVRNFNKLWGVTRASVDAEGNRVSYDSSVKQAIRRKWGSTGSDYVETLMRDLQSGRQGEQSTLTRLLRQARSRYAGAVLELNLGVAVKQAASYPTAAAVIGYRPLIEALASREQVDPALVAKYTPLLWYRSQGFSTQELGDLKSQGKSLPPFLNWIQGMDIATTKRLWLAAELYVRQENQALRRGSDAYYEAVAEVYNRIIEETQPNYTTMQRPQVLRSQNELAKVLNMFKTQPFQNFNILYDAFGELRARRTALQNSGTAEARQAYEAARKKAVLAFSSQALSAFTFALMQFAWDAMRGKLKRYKDEDDEVTLLAWMKGMGLNMLSNLGGMLPFGGAVLELLESTVDKLLAAFGAEPFFDQSFYGLGDSVVDTVNNLGIGAQDFLVTSAKMLSAWQNGEKVNWESSLRRLYGDAAKVTQIFGLPLNNVKNLMEAVTTTLFRLKDRGVLGEYETLRITTDPANSKKDYYDLLYKAMRAEPESYDEIRERMEKDGGFKADAVTSALKERIRDDYRTGKLDDTEATVYLVKYLDYKLTATGSKSIRYLLDSWHYEGDGSFGYGVQWEAAWQTGSAKKAVEYIQQQYGKADVKSSLSEWCKKRYQEAGTPAERQQIKRFLLSSGLFTEKDVAEYFSRWNESAAKAAGESKKADEAEAAARRRLLGS